MFIGSFLSACTIKLLTTLPSDDPRQRCPDISLAKSTLNWKPTIELREGIEKTAAYFKQII